METIGPEPPPAARLAALAVAARTHLRREWGNLPGCLGLAALAVAVWLPVLWGLKRLIFG